MTSHTTSVLQLALAAGCTCVLPVQSAVPDSRASGGVPAGPDLAIGSLNGATAFGTVDGVSAYAVAFTWCNVGEGMVLWCTSDVDGLCGLADHPATTQNLYRLRSGRFEQIGMSWMLHHPCALDEGLCGTCVPDPHGCDALGAGCSNAASASVAGSQALLGPRSQVDATSGDLEYPFAAPPAEAIIGRRLQVLVGDLDPTLNAGALYFAEVHAIAHDDAQAGHALNNASHRQVIIGPAIAGTHVLSLSGPSVQQVPAIQAWKSHGLGPGVPDPDVELIEVDVADDGRFIVGCKVSDNLDGTWHYEYAVLNLNSDRAARSFLVPVDPCVTVTAIEQHLPRHHSGEPYSNRSWEQRRDASGVRWSTASFEDAPDTNALRFSTLVNFRFDADRPPAPGEVELGLFKPGSSPDPAVLLLIPRADTADLDCDGVVGGADLGILLGHWGVCGPPCAADLDGNGAVDGADIGLLLGAWNR